MNNVLNCVKFVAHVAIARFMIFNTSWDLKGLSRLRSGAAQDAMLGRSCGLGARLAGSSRFDSAQGRCKQHHLNKGGPVDRS